MATTLLRRLAAPLVGASACALLLGACGGKISDTADASGDGATADCGTVNLAVNPWVGYEASIHVVGRIAEQELGCQVEYKELAEQVSWQGFASGDVDVIIENWGHEDLIAKYVDDQGVAQVVGPNGNTGVIGWFVPPWMAEKYPDITSWENLNRYADLFRTSESGDQGQLLDGDPSYVTNDEALVKNLDLDFKVVYAGSEAALVQAFRQAEKNRTPLIGYFYEPHWLFAELPLVQVQLPEYTEGCDADAAKVACGYPDYTLTKVVSTRLAESGSPAYDLVKAFEWTNDEQNEVARMIAEDGMDPDDAAQAWIDENPDIVQGWLGS